MMRGLILCLLAVLFSQSANAALFDDKEARKKIVEVDQQVQAQNQTLNELKKNQQALTERVAAIEAIVKGQGLVDLLNQIDRLNQELSKVKGELEVATHNIETTQQRQKDLYGDTDARLRKLEETNTSAPTASTPNAAATQLAAENTDFDEAQALSKAGKHKEAFDAYEKFLQTHPDSARKSEVQYLLGFTQFTLKNYKAAIATQQKMLAQSPDSPRAPDAMFNIANSQIQLSDIEGAKKTLRILLSQYPASEIAPNAKKRLSVLESIKAKAQ